MNLSERKRVRILFDEFHSESWSVSAARAREMQPEDPSNASYELAAEALAQRDFEVQRNLSTPLTKELLAGINLLALLHPCDRKWEHTTSTNSPALSAQEIEAVLQFVHAGGGLLVITEYEHDKYGDNLNELLEPAGLRIENGKVFDRGHCLHENPEWILSGAKADSPLSFLASRACFYRTGWCQTLGSSSNGESPSNGESQSNGESPQIAWQASAEANPTQAGLIGLAPYGNGRVGLVTDSNLFGDERLRCFDHAQLWLNLLYWLAVPTFFPAPTRIPTSASGEAVDSAEKSGLPERWSRCLTGNPAIRAGEQTSVEAQKLVTEVNALRALQQLPDGSIDPTLHPAATQLVDSILISLGALRSEFPHQEAYLDQLPRDFAAWKQAGFSKPDFGESLNTFHPEKHRRDQIQNLVLFPMYTPNASREIRFEAIIMRTPWPDWLARLESSTYRNPKFVPGHFVTYTEGYASECAVLFPETIALSTRPSNHFAVIYCDREARRLQRYALGAAHVVQLQLPPELECLLGSMPLLLDTMALWDLIHDASHSLGELPFDPFMIRQRAPFWMYGLEELRVDLRSFEEAARLAAEGFPFARYVCSVIVLDRIFRFPISGPRLRNYDAFGGQLLFAFLHQHDILVWRDNRLSIRWEALPEGIHALRQELTTLYKLAANCSKMAFWLAAHDLASKYLRPNVASKWKADNRSITDECDPKKWIAMVHDDEFPLGNFHLNLLRKLQALG